MEARKRIEKPLNKRKTMSQTMKTIINKDDRTVTVKKDGTSLTLTFTEAQDISETIDEEIYFKQDLRQQSPE